MRFPGSRKHVARQLAHAGLQNQHRSGQHRGDMPFYGPMAKLPDAPVLGTGSFGSVGGNPSRATNLMPVREVC